MIAEDAKYDEDGVLRAVRHNDYLGQEWRSLWKRAGLDRPTGLGFGALRHTFYTVGRQSKDYDGVNVIMGHASGGMTEHYLEDVGLGGLRSVTGYVRKWLWPDADSEAADVVAKVG